MHRTALVVGPLAILAAGIAAALVTAGSTSRQRTAPGPPSPAAVAADPPRAAAWALPAVAPAARPAVAPAARPALASAAPTVDLDEVVDPNPYVYRDFYTGLAVSPRRSTWVLRRAGENASLRFTAEYSNLDHTVWTPAWQHESTRTFVGTVARDGTRTILHLTSAGGAVLDMTCAPQRVAIHGAGARLLPAPPRRGAEECMNTEGVWRPARTYTIDVLACSASERSAAPEYHGGMLFAPDPGVESVGVNSDCILQGGGLRRALR